MTDPVSLTFGITSLLQVIAQTSVAVASFVQTYRKARADLLGIDQELSVLKNILEWLKKDTKDIQDVSIPESLSDQIVTIISHCNGTLKKIKSVLEKHEDWRGPARWALDGKKEVSGLQPELAAYRGALNVALITIDIVLSRDIKADTAAIRDDTEDLKLGQKQILAKIEELLDQIPHVDRENNPVVERYLETVASYAGSVRSEIIEWEEHEHIEQSQESGSQKNSVTVKQGEVHVIARTCSSGSGEGLSPQLDGGQDTAFPSSPRTPASSFKNQTQTENSPSPSLQTYNSPCDEMTNRFQEESSEAREPKQQTKLVLETTSPLEAPSPLEVRSSLEATSPLETTSPVECNEPMDLFEFQRFPTNQPQVAWDQYDAASVLVNRQSLWSVSDNAVSLQSISICDSKVSLSSKVKPRATIPLPSGNWILEESIDVGKAGKVKMVRKKGTKTRAACKIISRPRASDENSSVREIRIAPYANRIFLLAHPYICRHIDILQTENHWYLILEYIDGGSLSQYLTNYGRPKEKQAKKFSRQILSALDYCHQHGVIHRDLLPQNILLTSQEDVKLKGFVRDNLFSPNGHLLTSSGYRYYAAPEALQGSPFLGPEVDVWSFGVVLYRLVCGTVPFSAETSARLLTNIIHGRVEYRSDMNAACKDLISRILVTDPRNRATLKDVMNDPWLVRGYDSPPSNYVPSREPLSFPLDDEVIKKMTRFNTYSPDAIKEQLTQIIGSEAYQRAATRLQIERDAPGEPQGVKQGPMQRIRGLYKKQTPGTSITELHNLAARSTEPSTANNMMSTFDPLVHMYYLARDRYEKC